MDKVTKQFYEAMKDVLPKLILSDSDYKRYQVARAKKIIPPFELLIELVDYIPADIALAVLRTKEDCINSLVTSSFGSFCFVLGLIKMSRTLYKLGIQFNSLIKKILTSFL